MGAEKEDAQSMYDYGIILLKVSTVMQSIFRCDINVCTTYVHTILLIK
jgi:hypothetical protein